MKSAANFFVVIFTITTLISMINGDSDEIVVPAAEFYAVRDALNFKGKVVLITGSSSGIGATTARLFAALNARVVVTGRNETRIREVVKDCQKLSPSRLKPLGLKLDLAIKGNAGRLVNETICAFTKVDILVNCIGMAFFSTIQDKNYNKVLEDSLAVNLKAPTEVARLCAPYIQRNKGSMVFISSIAARNPQTSFSPYSMAKNAIIALAMTLAHDMGPDVRVNVISPGMVDGTRIFRSFDPSIRSISIKNAIKSTSLKKAGVPMDIAKLIVFLASPLSSSLDGQEIRADQGAYIPLF